MYAGTMEEGYIVVERRNFDFVGVKMKSISKFKLCLGLFWYNGLARVNLVSV